MPPVCDIALVGFTPLGKVEYEGELSGKTDKLKRLAKLSLAARCAVLCGCITDSRKILRKSVAVAEGGRLLGISDMQNVFDGEEFKSGAGVGIYTLGGYKVGICIENDIYFPRLAEIFAECGCNLVAAFSQGLLDGAAPTVVRAYAYLYGMPYVLCAGGAAFFADSDGTLASSNKEFAAFEVLAKNRYRTVTHRRRGVFAEERQDY